MKFILTSSLFEGEIVLEYAESGFLCAYRNGAQMTDEQIIYFLRNIPVTVPQLEEIAGKSKSLTIKQVFKDLSFATFWQEYNYKIGKKERSEKLWNGLSDAEKVQVLDSIPAYNYFLTIKKNQDRLYPETYLAQRRYEYDYKVLARKT